MILLKNFIYNLMNFRVHIVDKKKGFFSQSGQDKYIAEILLNNMRNGTFVDIGAHDGIKFNNTYYFESKLSWSGLAIEPVPDVYKKLKKNRNCKTVNACIADFEGHAEFLKLEGKNGIDMLSGIVDKYDEKHKKRIARELKESAGKKEVIIVKCYVLHNVLKNFSISKIDYLSIDTEGGELDILKSIDFKKINIEVVSVENNYKSLKFRFLMKKFGYKLVAISEGDEIYKKHYS